MKTIISNLIKNINCKTCTKCIFYRFSKDINNPFGICEKVGEKNIIDGKIKYYNALYTRKRICGINAKYYIPHNYDKEGPK
jgi:hypothetical protein